MPLKAAFYSSAATFHGSTVYFSDRAATFSEPIPSFSFNSTLSELTATFLSSISAFFSAKGKCSTRNFYVPTRFSSLTPTVHVTPRNVKFEFKTAS